MSITEKRDRSQALAELLKKLPETDQRVLLAYGEGMVVMAERCGGKPTPQPPEPPRA